MPARSRSRVFVAALVVGWVGLFALAGTARAALGGPVSVADDAEDLVDCEDKTKPVDGPAGFDLSELTFGEDADGNVVMIVRSHGNLSDTVRDGLGLLDGRIDVAGDGSYYRMLGGTPEGHPISEVIDPTGAVLPDELLVGREDETGGAIMHLPATLADQLGSASRVGFSVSYRDVATGQIVCDIIELDEAGKPTLPVGGPVAITTAATATTTIPPPETQPPTPLSSVPETHPNARGAADDSGGSSLGWWLALAVAVLGGAAALALFLRGRHRAGEADDASAPWGSSIRPLPLRTRVLLGKVRDRPLVLPDEIEQPPPCVDLDARCEELQRAAAEARERYETSPSNDSFGALKDAEAAADAACEQAWLCHEAAGDLPPVGFGLDDTTDCARLDERCARLREVVLRARQRVQEADSAQIDLETLTDQAVGDETIAARALEQEGLEALRAAREALIAAEEAADAACRAAQECHEQARRLGLE